MRLRYWVMACAAAAASTFAGCSYNSAERAALEPATPGMGFFFLDEGASAKLAYGVANSDNVGLMMECDKGSRLVRVTDLVRSNAAPVIILASAGKRSELAAKVDPGMGQPLVTASAPSASPAFTGFRRSGKIEVSYAGLNYAVAAKDFEKPQVEKFFAACEGRKA